MLALSLRHRLAGLSLAGLLFLAACGEPATSTAVPALPSNTAAAATAAPAASATTAPAPPTTAPAATNTALPAATDTAAPPATNTAPPSPTEIPPPPPTTTPVPAAPSDTPAAPATTNTPAPGATNTPAAAATASPGKPVSWQLVSSDVQDPRSPLLSAPGGVLYAGGDGVYRSTDGGAHWTALTTAFAVTDIAVAAADSKVIYAGRGEGCASGIPGQFYRSTDSGITWQQRPAGPYQFEANLPDPNVVFALRCDGVYRSTDGGQTLHKLPGTGNTLRDALFLVEGVNNPAYLYAVYVSEGGTPAVSRSTDQGQTWTNLPDMNQTAPRSFVVDPKDARHVYFLGANGFLSSADGGQTWNAHNGGIKPDALGYELSNLALDTVSPPPSGATATLYMASGQPGAVYRWNGKDSWVRIAPAPPDQDIYRLLVVPVANAPALLAVTDGGLYRLPLR